MTEAAPPSTLIEALGLAPGEVVALVGAGGKTTLLRRLAREGVALGWRVLHTSTTHVGPPRPEDGPAFLEVDGDPGPALDAALAERRRALLLGRQVSDHKYAGVRPERVDALAARADLVLVEADGARGRSLKMPAAHEPVVPRCATRVLVVCALDVLGAPLDETRVHRLERVCAALALAPGAAVDEDALAGALVHPEGYLSRLPAGARPAVFFNKAEDDERRAAAARLAARLCGPYERVVCGSARAGPVASWRASGPRRAAATSASRPAVAAIVLAAGASTRMGRPKALLDLGGRTLLRAALDPLLCAGLERVIVVLGCEAERIRAEAGLPEDPRLAVVVNPDWGEGLSTSLRCGLEACGAGVTAALVALGDQPGLAPGVVRALVRAHAAGARLALPVHAGRAGHPVLFTRALWDELREARGEAGGREVVRRHWDEAARLEAASPPDVDTPEDYAALCAGRALRADGLPAPR